MEPQVIYYTQSEKNPNVSDALAVAQNNSLAFADTANQNLAQMAADAINAFDQFKVPNLIWTTPSVPTISVNTTPVQPWIDPQVSVQAPAVPSFDSLPTFTTASAPEFTKELGTLNLPVAPDFESLTAVGPVPDMGDVTIPDVITLNLPEVPTFDNLSIEPVPPIDIPHFTGELAGSVDLTLPSETFKAYTEQLYGSDLLSTLTSKLTRDLMYGGYGIEPGDEASLWQRAMDREMRNTDAALQSAARDVAARGFMLPPGAFFQQLEAARQDGMEKAASASREVTLKRADMYVDNRKFTIEQAQKVEQMMITYYGYMMERALNIAKAVVELDIQLYNARVSQLNYFIEREKARAQVYEVVVRSALANLEAFKIGIERQKLITDVQRNKIEVYKAQLEGVNAMIAVNRTQIENARTRVDIEKIKMDRFKSVIEAYSAQVASQVVQLQKYEAEIKGQLAQVSVFNAQVEGFNTKVQAYSTKVQADKVAFDAKVEPYKLKLEQYKADSMRYGEDLRNAQVKLQLATQRFDANTRAHVVDVDAQIKAASLLVDEYRIQADTSMKSVQTSAELVIQQSKVNEAAIAASAQVSASLASSFGSVSSTAINAASSFVAQVTSA